MTSCKNCNNKNNYDPTSNNYNKEIKNKAHEYSPFGKKESSSRTTFK